MSDKKSIPFKEGLFECPEGNKKDAHILGVRCNACGKYAFPPRPVCIFCHSKNVVGIPLSRKGKLHSFTICRVPVPKMSPPYAIGYTDLPEGVRIFSQLEGWRDAVLKVDMEMEMVVGKIKTDDQGNDIVSYKFRPARVQSY